MGVETLTTPYWVAGIIFFIIISSIITYSLQKRSISKIKRRVEEGNPEIK